jgi:hypothetical protein
MIRRRLISVCVVALFGILLMGQDCPAQTGLCDPDPCQGIANAVAGTCMEIGGSCTGPSDYMCTCDLGYTWQGGTHTCEGSQPSCIDNDEDGYGNPADASCTYPELDCDDTNGDVYPGAPELCEGIDNQCVGDPGYGQIDEQCPVIVFLTAGAYEPIEIGGVSGASSICIAEANSAGLPGFYGAWLSDSSVSPATHWPHYDVPYQLVDGTVIADNWSDLTDGTIQHPINMFPTGTEVPDALVWSNTHPNGAALNYLGDPDLDSCDEWTSDAITGFLGRASRSDGGWTATGDYTSCSEAGGAFLYCFRGFQTW